MYNIAFFGSPDFSARILLELQSFCKKNKHTGETDSEKRTKLEDTMNEHNKNVVCDNLTINPN